MIDAFAFYPWSDEIVPVPPDIRHPSIRARAPSAPTFERRTEPPRFDLAAKIIRLDGHLMVAPRPEYRFVVYVESTEELARFERSIAVAWRAACLLHLVRELTTRK